MFDTILSAINVFKTLYEQYQQILDNEHAGSTLYQKILELERRIEEISGDSTRVEAGSSLEEKLTEIRNKIDEINSYISRTFVNPNVGKRLRKIFRSATITRRLSGLRASVVELNRELSDLLITDTHARIVHRQTCSIEEVRQNLRAYYREKSTIKLLAGETGIPVDDLYINVVIVEQEEKGNSKERMPDEVKSFIEHGEGTANEIDDIYSAKQRIGEDQGILSGAEDVVRPKRMLEIHQIFDPTVVIEEGPRRPIKRVQLLGRAGIGKTTLCRYIAYQWANGALFNDQFDWMFYLSLKEVAALFSDPGEYPISEILFRAIFRKEPFCLTIEQTRDLWEKIQQYPEKVGFMLDGRDEVAHLNHPVVNTLLEHLPCYLVTARPYAELEKETHQIDATLENTGFTEENIDTYIRKYFQRFMTEVPVGTQGACEAKAEQKDEASSEQGDETASEADVLIDWLNRHPEQRRLCHIPLLCELYCILMDDETTQALFERENLLTGDIFKAIIDKLVYRYLMNNHRELGLSIAGMTVDQILSDEEARKIREFVNHLSFEGMKSGRLVIEQALVERVRQSDPEFRCDNRILIKLRQSGFLKAAGGQANQGFYFLHLLFEEFAAGQYMIDHIDDDDVQQFIREYKFNPTYQQIFYHAAYIVKDNPEKLNQYFDLLLSPPREISDGQYELCLLLNCGESCGWSEELNVREQLLRHAGNWLHYAVEDGIRFSYLEEQYALLLKTLNDCPRSQQLITYQDSCGVLPILRSGIARSRMQSTVALNIIKKFFAPKGQWQEGLVVIREWLNDKNHAVREIAMDLMREYSVPQDQLEDALALVDQGLSDREGRVSTKAFHALVTLDIDKTPWQEVLASQHESIVEKSSDCGLFKYVIEELTLPEEEWRAEVEIVREWSESENETVREAALMIVPKISVPAEQWQAGLEVICEYLDSDNENVRKAASRMISQVSVPAEQWQAGLGMPREWLSHDDEISHISAIKCLLQLVVPEERWGEMQNLLCQGLGYSYESIEYSYFALGCISELVVPAKAWEEGLALATLCLRKYGEFYQRQVDRIDSSASNGVEGINRDVLGSLGENIHNGIKTFVQQLAIPADQWKRGLEVAREWRSVGSYHAHRVVSRLILNISVPEEEWRAGIEVVREWLDSGNEDVCRAAIEVIPRVSVPEECWEEGLQVVREWLNEDNESSRIAAMTLLPQLKVPEKCWGKMQNLLCQGFGDNDEIVRIETLEIIPKLAMPEGSCLDVLTHLLAPWLGDDEEEAFEDSELRGSVHYAIVSSSLLFKQFILSYGSMNISKNDNARILRLFLTINPQSVCWVNSQGNVSWVVDGNENEFACENPELLACDLLLTSSHRERLMTHSQCLKFSEYKAYVADVFNQFITTRSTPSWMGMFMPAPDCELSAARFVVQCVESDSFTNFQKIQESFEGDSTNGHRYTLSSGELGHLFKFFLDYPVDLNLDNPVESLRHQLETQTHSAGCVMA